MRDLGAAVVEHEIERVAPHDLAQRARGDGRERRFRIAHVEQEALHVGALVLHDDLDIDEVFVASQQIRAVRHVIRRGDIDLFNGLDRPRQMPLLAGLSEPLECTEPEHEPSLAFFDAKEARGEPDGGEHHDARDDETPVQRRIAALARAAATPAEQRNEPTLQIADDGVEIRRTFVLVGSPRIALVAVVPSHRSLHFFADGVGRQP